MITAHNMTLSITGIMMSVYPAVSDRDMVKTPAGAKGVMVKPLAATLAARANSRVVCNSFFRGSLLSLFFIKDRSCFRSNYFKYIETEAVLFPEPVKEGGLLMDLYRTWRGSPPYFFVVVTIRYPSLRKLPRLYRLSGWTVPIRWQ